MYFSAFFSHLTLFSMLAPLALLLDEGSPITVTVGLLKMAGGAVLYWLAWRLFFRKGLTADLRLLGVGLACALAIIGFLTWPVNYSWEGHTFFDYFFVFILCVPLLAAAIRFVYRMAHNARKQ